MSILFNEGSNLDTSNSLFVKPEQQSTIIATKIISIIAIIIFIHTEKKKGKRKIFHKCAYA